MKENSLALITKNIDEVNQSLKRNKELQLKYPEKDGIKVNYNALKHIQETLIDKRSKIIERMNMETIELSLEGKEVEEDRISAIYLGNILTKLFNLIDQIAFTKKRGVEAKGEIPVDIKEGARFDVLNFNPGSFKITLSSHSFSKNQSTLVPTLAKLSFDQFIELINCEDDPNLLRKQWQKLGDKTIIKYRKFLGTIRSGKSDIKFHDKTSNEIITELTNEQAKKIFKIIQEEDEQKPIDDLYKGNLVAIDVDKHKFGFIFEDTEERIDGKINKETRSTIKITLDEPLFCTLKLRKYRKYNDIKESFNYTWELLDFGE